jgi:hypothetical protein
MDYIAGAPPYGVFNAIHVPVMERFCNALVMAISFHHFMTHPDLEMNNHKALFFNDLGSVKALGYRFACQRLG